MLIDELASRRFAKRTTIRRLSPGLLDPMRPIFHPDQHILPALRSLEDACKHSMRHPDKARDLAWKAIKHAEICNMPKVIRSARALLLALGVVWRNRG